MQTPQNSGITITGAFKPENRKEILETMGIQLTVNIEKI